MPQMPFRDAKVLRNTMERNTRSLGIALRQFPVHSNGLATADTKANPEYQEVRQKFLAATVEFEEFTKGYKIVYKAELVEEHKARMRARNSTPDHRYRYTPPVMPTLALNLPTIDTGNDAKRAIRQAQIAFEASGLSRNQKVTIWRQPVTVKEPISRNQVRTVNRLIKDGIIVGSFESIDRYEAIPEANHGAIAIALECDDKTYLPKAAQVLHTAPEAAPEAPSLTLDL